MDAWGIAIFAIGLIGYGVSKKKPAFLFVAGFGAGILAGAIWAVMIVNSL